jgi:nucleoside-diphosphate-sugar epimerase
VILVNGGTGICNAVYVDDVVTALLLAATSDRAPGERFLISGPDHPTWRDFFAAYEGMLGLRRTVSLSEAEALAHWHRSRQRPWLLPEALRVAWQDAALRERLLTTREGAVLRRVARGLPARFMPVPRHQSAGTDTARPLESEPPLAPLRPWLVRYLASKPRVSIDKARAYLGYEPVFHLDAGMHLTEQWARWAGLLP